MSRLLDPDERTISFERWWNVRDLGGIPTDSGFPTRLHVVLRATTPEYATDADVAKIRRLGWRRFVDLRSPRDAPVWLGDGAGIRRRVVDLVGSVRTGRETPEEVLTFILDQGHREVAEAIVAITEFAEDSTPVVVHCHTGKDRTGLIAIILLRLAGVGADAILEDYLASNPGFEAMRETLEPSGFPLYSPNAPKAVRGPVLPVAAEAALRFLDEAGGVREYLIAAGMAAEQIEKAAGLLRSQK